MSTSEITVIAGVGPGLGRALAQRFAREGHQVLMLARNAEKLRALAEEDPQRLLPFACDVSQPEDVSRAFAEVDRLGVLACAVYNAGTFQPGSILDIRPEDFERAWRVGCLGGMLVGQAAARRMVARGRGSILYTGATASLRGGASFASLASPKFALRAVAQSMARELGPKGVHVAHVVIDGRIRAAGSGDDSMLDPEAVAALYADLHRQPRSVWAMELDVRPYSERF